MSDHELPESYVPPDLRPDGTRDRVQVTYGVGFRKRDADRSYGMTNGPFPVLKDALDTVPPDRTPVDYYACIIRYNKDGTDEELYRWKDGKWVKWQGKDTWDRAMKGGHG